MTSYYIRHDTTPSDGSPLDAHIAKVCIQGNLDAVYEGSVLDYSVVFQAYEQASSTLAHGPHPILMRLDRNGLVRPISIQPLCSGGNAIRTLTAYLTPRYYKPDTRDATTSWNVTATTTATWLTAGTITPGQGWMPHLFRLPSNDELGLCRIGWLSFWWSAYSGTAPTFVGFRVYESLATS